MASLISASVASTLAGVLSLLFGFLSSIATARLLGPEGAGIVAYSLWIAATAAALSDLGVPAILLRYANKSQTQTLLDGGLTQALTSRIVPPTLLLATAMIGYACWSWIEGSANEAMLWIATTFYFLTFTSASVALGVERGVFRFAESGKVTVFGCLLQVPILALGAFFWGPAGALLGYMARYLPQALSLTLYLRAAAPNTSPVTKSMRDFGRNTWLSNIVGMFVWARMEFLFLGWFATAYQLGLYAASLTLASLVVQLPTQMLAGLTPHFSRHHDNNNVRQLTVTYHRVLRWISLMLFPVAFGGAAVMPQMLPLLFGTEFQAASNIAAILLFFSVATALSIIPSSLINARERSDFFLWASPSSAVFSLFLLGSIIPFFGAEGAAWARGVVHLSWLVILIWFSWKTLSIAPNLTDFLRVGISAGICATVALITISALPSLPGMLIAIASAALVYLFAVKLLRIVPADDLISLQNNLPAKIPRPVTQFAFKILYFISYRDAS